MGLFKYLIDKVFPEVEVPVEITHIKTEKCNKEKTISPDISILDKFIGQKHILDLIKGQIVGAIKNNSYLPHFLLGGFAGYGKTTLARAISKCIGSNCHVVTGPNVTSNEIVEKIIDMDDYDVLLIDEIHSMKYKVQEILYEAMQDFSIDGVPICKIIVIGATTRPNSLNKPLRDRFMLNFLMGEYSKEELVDIIKVNCPKLHKDISFSVAYRSKGTPRKAKNFAIIILNEFASRDIDINPEAITGEHINLVVEIFDKLGIGHDGLDKKDIMYLNVINHDKAFGVSHIAKVMQQKTEDIEFGIEPYLLVRRFIEITPKGRMLTQEGRKRLNETNISKMA